MAATRLLAQQTCFKVLPFQEQDFLDGSTWPTSMGKPRFRSALVYSWKTNPGTGSTCLIPVGTVQVLKAYDRSGKGVTNKSLLSSGTMHDAVREVLHSLKQDGDMGCKRQTHDFRWII